MINHYLQIAKKMPLVCLKRDCASDKSLISDTINFSCISPKINEEMFISEDTEIPMIFFQKKQIRK